MAFSAPNYTQTPNLLFDELFKTLKEGELRVILVILRQTFGWHKAADRISLSQLAEKSGMNRPSVCRSLNSLMQKGLVQKKKFGDSGQERCYYSLVVEEVENNKIKDDDGLETEEERKIISNNLDQSPKETGPVSLGDPTKETKQKKEEKERDGGKPPDPPPPLSFFTDGQVKMLQSEYDQLVKEFDAFRVSEMVENLNLYAKKFPAKFKKYACHAAVIKTWLRKEDREKRSQQAAPNKKTNALSDLLARLSPNFSYTLDFNNLKIYSLYGYVVANFEKSDIGGISKFLKSKML